MANVFVFRAFVVTMISFLLLNAFLPSEYKHLRRSFLVSQTLWTFLIGQTQMSSAERKATYRYVTFGVTFLYLYFIHTHEYVGDQ